MKINQLNIVITLFALAVWNACVVKPTNTPTDEPGKSSRTADFLSADQIQNLAIARLETDTLEGIRVPDVQDPFISDLSVDSIIIDLDQNNYERDQTSQSLKLGEIQVNRLVSQPSNGRPTSKSPVRIESLMLRTVILKKDGKEVKRLYNHRQTNFHANWFIEKTADTWAEKEQQYKLQIERLEQEIGKLRVLINTVLEQYPDHAARMMDPDLSHIEDVVAEIREWHSKYLPDLETIQSDINRLASMELTVFDMTEALQDPAQTQATLETKVLFRTGEYLIARFEPIRILDSLTRQITAMIEPEIKNYPDRTIKVNLAVTGYADNQAIYGELASNLYIGQTLPKGVIRGSDSKAEQDFLNLRLSQERAKAVSRYIESALRKRLPKEKIVLACDPLGRGRNPDVLNVRCASADCPEQRVVVISDVSYSLGDETENR